MFLLCVHSKNRFLDQNGKIFEYVLRQLFYHEFENKPFLKGMNIKYEGMKQWFCLLRANF